MKEMMKNVKIIFTELHGCPAIDMPSEVYNTKVVGFFKVNDNDYIRFDDFICYIKHLPTPIQCNAFLTWCANHSIYGYYWPKCKMSVDVSNGYYTDVVRIGGLIKMRYDDIKTTDYTANKYISILVMKRSMHIKDVIFNDPATIVLWKDGTKTVVKCQEGDNYDKEKGLALCIAKKALGNKGNFNNEFKRWLEE